MEDIQSNAPRQTLPATADSEKADRFETIDYVRELFLLTAEQQKSERTKLKLLRACTALLAATLALLLIVCAVVLPAALRVSGELSQTLTIVRDADLDGLVTKLQSFTTDAGAALSAVGDAAKVLDQIDIVSLNLAIEKLQGAVDTLSSIDVDKLNAAISNLNDTVEPFANFFAKFR